MKKNLRNDSALAWLLLIILSVIWGSSFILIKKALVSFTALEVGAARVSISFLAFLPLFIKYFKEIPWHKYKAFIVVGVCGSGLPAFLYAIGQTEIPSSIAGVINSLTPVFTLILAILFFNGKLIKKQLFGIILSILGVLMLFFIKREGQIAFPIGMSLLLVLATISYAVSANTLSKYLSSVRPTVISVISFTILGPFMLAYLLSTDFISHITETEHGWNSLMAVSALSLLGTFLANILFFRLIQLTDAVFASSVSFVIPIVALLWGIVDGEIITIFHFLALLFILGGVFLVKSFKHKSL